MIRRCAADDNRCPLPAVIEQTVQYFGAARARYLCVRHRNLPTGGFPVIATTQLGGVATCRNGHHVYAGSNVHLIDVKGWACAFGDEVYERRRAVRHG